MRGDWEELEGLKPSPWDWTWGAVATVFIIFGALAFFASGCADAADPVEVALADLKADKAVRAAMRTPAAGRGSKVGRDSPPSVQLLPAKQVPAPFFTRAAGPANTATFAGNVDTSFGTTHMAGRGIQTIGVHGASPGLIRLLPGGVGSNCGPNG